MPIAVLCPGCNARLNAPDAAAGKTVKCPKCKAAMVVPAPAADAGFEAVDDPTPPPKKPAPASARPPRAKTDVTLDDSEDEKPRARKKSRDDEDDKEEDDRPRKKGKGKKKAAAGPAPAVLIAAIAGGVLLLGGGAFAAYWFGIRDDKPKETTGNPTPNAPPGPQPGGPGGFPPPGSGGGPPVQPGGPVKPIHETSTTAFRQNSKNNLKQIALSFHLFADTHNGMLPAGIFDSGGKVGLSWRVALLPYLELDQLYKQFHLDEPWDSDHNKKLIPQMPRVFAAPGATSNGLTYYRSFTGPDTVFPPPQRGPAGQPATGLKIVAIPDGTSNTALVVEAGEPVEWTKPDELVYTAGAPLPKVGGIFGDGYHVVLADGSTNWLTTGTPAEMLKAIITAKGGETVNWGK
ncbi:MAG: hypothetical protein JWO38_1491 [Gemmataceae bacterium]|nr:hypothetical protein [Gemmataceae bacterium]